MAHKILYVPLIKDRMSNFVTNPQEVSHLHAHIYNRDGALLSSLSLFPSLSRRWGPFSSSNDQDLAEGVNDALMGLAKPLLSLWTRNWTLPPPY